MSFFHPAHRPIYRSGTSAAKDGENFETKTLMKTNAFIKLGPITILAAILIASSVPPTEASSVDSSNAKKSDAPSSNHATGSSNDPDHARPSQEVRFDYVDGSPLRG